MIDPLSTAVLKQERVSLPVLVTVGVVHIGALWVMLQTAPSLQLTRNVVYQLLSPITRIKEPPPKTRTVAPSAVREVRAPVPTVNAIQERKPLERSVERPVEKVHAEIVETVTEVKPVWECQNFCVQGVWMLAEVWRFSDFEFFK